MEACSPQGKSEKGAGICISEGAVEVQERLEGVWKLAEEIGPLEGNLEARLRRAGARQPFGMRVKHDKIVPTHKGWQICPVVDSIEAQTKALHGNTHIGHMRNVPFLICLDSLN